MEYSLRVDILYTIFVLCLLSTVEAKVTNENCSVKVIKNVTMKISGQKCKVLNLPVCDGKCLTQEDVYIDADRIKPLINGITCSCCQPVHLGRETFKAICYKGKKSYLVKRELKYPKICACSQKCGREAEKKEEAKRRFYINKNSDKNTLTARTKFRKYLKQLLRNKNAL